MVTQQFLDPHRIRLARSPTRLFPMPHRALIRAAFDHNRERIDALSARDLTRHAHRDPIASYWVASSLALAGRHDAAVEWVTNAVDRGFINYPLLAEHDPFLTKLCGQRDYEALLERVKHEWESFEI